jgi:hypothetical protein
MAIMPQDEIIDSQEYQTKAIGSPDWALRTSRNRAKFARASAINREKLLVN